MPRKNFYAQVRTPFLCQQCGKKNGDNLPSPRNHCRFCLSSLHLDQTVPGDRLSPCKGIMQPTAIEYTGKKGYILVQQCQTCGLQRKNKTALDDNFEFIIQLSSHSRPLRGRVREE